MKRMPKHITIDEPAMMVKAGFDEFEGFKKMLISFEKRLDSFEDTMQTGFKKMNQRFDALEDAKQRNDKETEVCRHHRALTDARLSRLESVIS